MGINISDIVRKYISEIHQRDPTYFSLKTVYERNQDFKLYCEQNSKTGMNYKNHRPLFSQLLSKQKDLLKLNLSQTQTQSKSEKYKVTKGTQQAEVTVNPTQQGQQSTSQTTQTTEQQSTSQTTGEAKQVILHPPTCQCNTCMIKRGEIQPLEPEEAGGILEIFIDFWHSRNPDVELMSEAEVLRVGKRLAPILQRHLGGDILLYGLGIVTIGQVVMKRVDQAKKSKKKDKTKSKQDEANEKTSQEDTKTETEKEPEVHRKFFSREKIRAIEKLGEESDD